MTKDKREIQRKLRILRYAEEIGQFAKTCRYFGIGRASFYRVILRAFDEWHNETWVYEANRKTHSLETTSPMMSAGTSFHGNGSRGKLLHGSLKL